MLPRAASHSVQSESDGTERNAALTDGTCCKAGQLQPSPSALTKKGLLLFGHRDTAKGDAYLWDLLFAICWTCAGSIFQPAEQPEQMKSAIL